VGTLSTSDPSLAEPALLSEESLESDGRRADSNLVRGFWRAVEVPGAVVNMANMQRLFVGAAYMIEAGRRDLFAYAYEVELVY
jgi:hypothetical protein